jgi:peroxiredoxin
MNVRVLLSISLGWLWFTAAAAPAAQETVGFTKVPTREIVVAPFSDEELSGLVATLDALLARHADPARWAFDTELYLQHFVDRLQRGVLSPAQEARVVEHFQALEARYPSDATRFEKRRRAITALAIGKVAPDIVGRDLDGAEFRLSDYRGRVVVLTFSGDWCGACRAEYPYQRLLLELYEDRPFTLLGVSSDADPEAAGKAKADRHLAYRMWWDGDGKKRTEGPIATTWGVGGWPTVYVLDERGVIRFVNLRQEDLLKGVRQLMTELAQKPVPSKEP